MSVADILCSWCRVPARERQHMIAGADATICNVCMEKAKGLLDEPGKVVEWDHTPDMEESVTCGECHWFATIDGQMGWCQCPVPQHAEVGEDMVMTNLDANGCEGYTQPFEDNED